MKNALILLLLTAIAGCVTAHPEQSPVLHPEALPALKLPSLNPQTVSLTVTNKRAINMRANNSSQIEGVVKDAVAQSIARGGLTLAVQSKNTLAILISDCENVDPNLACVSIALTLKTKGYELEVSGKAENGKSSNGSSIPGMGDTSEAYQSSLAGVLENLPVQVNKMEAKLHK